MLRSTWCKQARGSAMVEYVLVLGALLPIGFGMAMIGKLTDMRQSAEQAGRYAAWEATVYSRKALANRQASTMNDRFFQMPDAPVSAMADQQEPNQRTAQLAHNPLWGSDKSERTPLRKMGRVSRLKDSSVTANYTFDTGKSSLALISGEIAALAGKPLSFFSGNSWDIVADGLLRTSIDVPLKTSVFLPGSETPCGNVANNSSATSNAAQDDKHVCVSSAAVILADGWGASGDAQAISRVRSLVPGSGLDWVGKGVGTLLGSTVFPELDPLNEAFGHVDMRVLPEYAKP